jgi:hypothetical protein
MAAVTVTAPDASNDPRQRHGQEERPPPTDLGQQAAEHEAEREPRRPGCGVDEQGLVPGRALGERRRDDRQPGRGGERRAHPLDEAGGDEHRPVRGQTTQPGEDEEHGKGDEEQPAPSEEVGGAAAEEQESAVPEDVAADDPLQRARRHVQVVANRRQGHADHRDVEGVEEQRAAQHDQRAPGPPADRRHGAACGKLGCRHGRLLEGSEG